jgi:hypothetical protein
MRYCLPYLPLAIRIFSQTYSFIQLCGSFLFLLKDIRNYINHLVSAALPKVAKESKEAAISQGIIALNFANVNTALWAVCTMGKSL